MFWATLDQWFAPLVRGRLIKEGLTEEEAEDCYAQALQKFIDRTGGGPTIRNPYAYLWRCVWSAVTDLHRAQQRDRSLVQQLADVPDELVIPGRHDGADDVDEADRGEWRPIAPARAVSVVEGLLDGVDAELGWAAKVLEAAIERLATAPRRVIRHLLVNGPDYNASRAPDDLRLSAEAFRQNKRRAYAALRKTIPAVMLELGIQATVSTVPDLNLRTARDFPTADGDDGPAGQMSQTPSSG